MGDFLVALIGIGMIMFVMGAIFRVTASRADPEVQKCLELPLRRAIEPPEGTPERLRPGQDLRIRADLFALGMAVATGKTAPYLLKWGPIAVAIGLLGVFVQRR